MHSTITDSVYLESLSRYPVMGQEEFDRLIKLAKAGDVEAKNQILEGNLLTPKLVGDRVGLHAVWIIFALLAGGSLFGFVGVLLAVPVMAVIGVLSRFVLGHYLNSPMYRSEVTERKAKDD